MQQVPLEIEWLLGVVYFDQRLGAAHAQTLVDICFLHIFCMKNMKKRKKQKMKQKSVFWPRLHPNAGRGLVVKVKFLHFFI